MKADVKQDEKTHERMESAASSDERFGDISLIRVNDEPMNQTSLGGVTGPSALTIFSDDTLADEGTEAPKPRLSPVEMRTSTTTGDLQHAGSASITLGTIIPLQPLSWSFYKNTKKRGNGTTTRRTNFNHLAPSCDRKMIKTKIRESVVFGSGGRSGRLRDRLILRGRRMLLRGRVHLGRCDEIQSWDVFDE